jgi:hypothetical protein
MATAVQVTLIICCTVVLLVAITVLSDRRHRANALRSERLGLYKRLLAAMAGIKSDPSDRKAWERLSAAAHAISLAAPPEVVSLTVACCRDMRERSLPPDATTARALLLAYRRDLGLADVADPEALDFDIVPSGPARSAG